MEINKKIINESVLDSLPTKISYASCRGQLNCSLCKTVHSKSKIDPITEFYNLHPGIKSTNYNQGVVFLVDSFPNKLGKLIRDRDVASLFNKFLTDSQIDNYYILPSVKCDVETLGMNATAKVRENCFELSKRLIIEKLKPKILVTDSVTIFNQITGLKFVSPGRISNSVGWSSELNCYVMIILKSKTLIDDMRISEEKTLETVRLANIRKGFSIMKEIIDGKYQEHLLRFDRSKINYRKLTLSSSEEEVSAYFEKLYASKQASVDIETTGLSPFIDEITMMAITIEVGEAMNFSKEFMDRHRTKFEKFFDSEIEKIFANGSFDIGFLMMDGYTFSGKLTDVQVYNYLNRNGLDYDISLTGVKHNSKNKSKSTNTLKYLSWIYTDLGGYEKTVKKQGGIIESQKTGKHKVRPKRVQNLELFQEVIKNNIYPSSNSTVDDAKNLLFEGEEPDKMLSDVEEYNCTDTDATYRIKLMLVDKSEERVHNIYNTLLGPLIFEVLVNIYIKGIRINEEYLDQLCVKYKGSEDGSKIGLIDQIKKSFDEELKKEIIESDKVSYNDIVKLYPEESSKDIENPGKDKDKLLSLFEININSSKQILALYKKLGYLESSDASVDGDVLDYLASKGIKSAEYKAKYQPVNKLYTTYILPFKKKSIDGVLHSSYRTDLVTGRLASSDPNMQNIPQDNEIRNICIAREGFSYLDLDYSAAELRVLAEVANQEDWIEGFIRDLDPHWQMARKMFAIPMNKRPKLDDMHSLVEVGNILQTRGVLKTNFDINDAYVMDEIKSCVKDYDSKRGSAKTLNFQIVYGSRAKGIAQKLHTDFNYVSKEQQKKYIEESKDLISMWFKAAPNIQLWLKNTHEFAKKHRYVETILGRRRYLVFADSNYKQFSSAAEREAGNTPIQSAASDMCAYAAVLTQRYINKFPEDDCRIVNIVHDNIILEVPDHKKDEYTKVVVNIMEKEANMLKRVPMKVDYQITKMWVK